MTADIMSIDNYIIVQNKMHDLLDVLDSINEPLAAVHVNQAVEVIKRRAKEMQIIKDAGL